VRRGARIVIAGIAAILYSDACPGRPVHMAMTQSEEMDLNRQLRDLQPSGRRICAIDRLSESMLPRTVCRTVQQWRDRQRRGLSRQ
jgi:hypothetical protein